MHLHSPSTWKQPQEAALRGKQPTSVTWDDTEYQTIRPGGMISCKADNELHDAELLTSSGVLVNDEHGSEFITVANHGFLDGQELVYHPTQKGV